MKSLKSEWLKKKKEADRLAILYGPRAVRTKQIRDELIKLTNMRLARAIEARKKRKAA